MSDDRMPLGPRHARPTPKARIDPPRSSYDGYLGVASPAADDHPLPDLFGATELYGVDTEQHAPATDTSRREVVTCPECGGRQDVHLTRRDAADFCQRCDFPLFWTPQRVTRERDGATEAESLRRLPGTVGRTTLASAPCPHCNEPNTVSAVVCVRCGRSMQWTPPPPPPPPAPAAPAPLPEPVLVEPERGIPWWVWLVVGLGIATVVLVALTLTGVIF